jgi:hypothetical protein
MTGLDNTDGTVLRNQGNEEKLVILIEKISRKNADGSA